MSSSPSTKIYGFRSLPNLLDERAKFGNDRPIAMFPKSRDTTAGFRQVGYIQLANAVNRACWWLEETMPHVKEIEGTFAYFGPNDLRYLIFVIAAMKTHRKILVASLRNTVQAQLELFERTNCQVIVSCSSLDRALEPIFVAASASQIRQYEYIEPAQSEACNRFLHVHTSGSSGNPKPISYTHEIVRSWDAPNFLPGEQGDSLARTMFRHQKVLCLLPCFHAGGLVVNIFAILLDMTLIQGHSEVPMTAQYVSELLQSGVVTTLLSPPSILEDLANDPAAQASSLSKLNHVAYAGGPLRPSTGSQLSKTVPHLFSYIGATECGWFHNLSGPSKLWDSLKFYSDIGYHFDEIFPGIFELIITKDERTNNFQPIFQVFPSLTEYRTRDLYSRNSEVDEEGWWKYRGRADDLIVLSNGEKINPIPLENIIVSHPSVKAALVIGEYRFIPSLLLEINPSSTPKTEIERHQLLDSIWPVVQEANKIAPGFSKIPKSLVLQTIFEGGKGTIQRQLTVRAYAEELEGLYGSQEADLLSEGLTLTKSKTPEAVRTFVREIYVDALEAEGLGDGENVFERGLDSLRVMIIVQRLRAALKVCEIGVDVEDVNPRLVYETWSVERMTEVIVGLANIQSKNDEKIEDAEHIRENRIRSMIEKYTNDLPSSTPIKQITRPLTSSGPWTVILTGTTGSLGSYLLAALLELPASRVKKIYCLNRSASASKTQEQSNRIRGITTDPSTRVEFLQVDLSNPTLSLSHEKYTELSQKTTLIIHSAWKVDFNLTLETFSPQLQGVRNLLDFSQNSTHQAPVIFISSISTTFNFPSKPVPETIIQSLSSPEGIGYAESKFVAERILDVYSKATSVPTAIFRTGQIAGPLSEKGVWNKQEWFPSLVASSKYLGALPETLGSFEVLDWIPVDVLSTIMIELAENVVQRRSAGTEVYNLVNPKFIPWSDVRYTVMEMLGIEKSVPLKEWVALLEKSMNEKQGMVGAINPAMKLHDFFRSLSEKDTARESRYEVKRLVRDSDAAGALEAVSVAWLELWFRQWGL